MSALQLKRLGQIMEPEAGNAHEVEGVLNDRPKVEEALKKLRRERRLRS